MGDSAEPVVFEASVESLRRTTVGRLGPSRLARLKALGFDFEAPLLPAYPRAPWEVATELIEVVHGWWECKAYKACISARRQVATARAALCSLPPGPVYPAESRRFRAPGQGPA